MAARYRVFKTTDGPLDGAVGYELFRQPKSGAFWQVYCAPGSTEIVLWDGLLNGGPPTCSWGASSTYDCELQQPGGKVLAIRKGLQCDWRDQNIFAADITLNYIYLNSTTCYWELGFFAVAYGPAPHDFCEEEGGVFWTGRKVGGLTPVGKYVATFTDVENTHMTALWVGLP